MIQSNSNFTFFYEEFIKKSLFTERQISIIYKKLTEHARVDDISSGAYYRQIKQCRDKINGIIYSILLLRLIGAIDSKTLTVIERVGKQLSDVLSNADSDINHDLNTNDVISVIHKLIDTMCKV